MTTSVEIEGGDVAGAPSPHVASLYRYPVKGLSPQAEPRLAMIAGEGLLADRRFAMTLGSTRFDPLAPEPLDKGFFLMLRRDETLAALATRYDEASGRLSIVEPGGETFDADIATAAGRDSVERFFLGYLGDVCEGQPRLVEANGHKFTDVSVISPEMMRAISVVNLASVRDLAERCGTPLDPLRFRANIYIEGVEPWTEFDWIDREIVLGSVRFRATMRTKRCAAVDVDPRTGVRDTHLPRTLMKTYGHPDCGIYLEVLNDGTVAVGDALRLL